MQKHKLSCVLLKGVLIIYWEGAWGFSGESSMLYQKKLRVNNFVPEKEGFTYFVPDIFCCILIRLFLWADILHCEHLAPYMFQHNLCLRGGHLFCTWKIKGGYFVSQKRGHLFCSHEKYPHALHTHTPKKKIMNSPLSCPHCNVIHKCTLIWVLNPRSISDILCSQRESNVSHERCAMLLLRNVELIDQAFNRVHAMWLYI